ncbi:hypothetical protein CHS0354_007232 [Potamilus streckersoni]|uniref:C-type lectin domain-containing protein n=1 Tax=Potamilus streckersoni TaxID=2493646 RepID=A0AAE0RYT2_9BIVA|nr:hypothetical protein CHS0354_007232 [Potamilus streckersoni]
MESTITQLIFTLVDILFIIQTAECNDIFIQSVSLVVPGNELVWDQMWKKKPSFKFPDIFSLLSTEKEKVVYCEMYGGHLVVIETDSEEKYIAGYISKLSPGSFNSGTFWLGASNLQVEGEWIWLNSGGKMRYSNWQQGEPNNANSNENCLEMSFSNNFRWNDNKCNNKFNFICETELVLSPF